MTYYSAPGTYSWALPAGAAWVQVFLIGGGAGGGSGAAGDATAQRSGGGGGAGGSVMTGAFLAADVDAWTEVDVGEGGRGRCGGDRRRARGMPGRGAG